MKVGIIGCGMVGAAVANALAIKESAEEIVLIDINKKKAQAEAEDIFHATSFIRSPKIYSGDYKDLKNADIIAITAGAAQKPGETRLDLLQKNAKIFKTIIPNVMKYAPKNIILLIITNPVDVMTMITKKLSGLPAKQVIGTGTTLDSARFTCILSEFLGVSTFSTTAHVLGEHGDSEVLAWESVRVGSLPEEQFAKQFKKKLTNKKIQDIDNKVRNAAYSIINGKGGTWYGIGACVEHIINVIEHNEREVLTTSIVEKVFNQKTPVAISLPRIVGNKGVVKTLIPNLSKEELSKLKGSINTIKKAYKSVKI